MFHVKLFHIDAYPELRFANFSRLFTVLSEIHA